MLFRLDVTTKSIARIDIWSIAGVGRGIHLRGVNSVSDSAIVTIFCSSYREQNNRQHDFGEKVK